jgi:hypothetical protein
MCSGMLYTVNHNSTVFWRGKAVAACRSHNPGVGGSIPPPATALEMTRGTEAITIRSLVRFLLVLTTQRPSPSRMGRHGPCRQRMIKRTFSLDIHSRYRGVAQSGSALALGARCRRFKSSHPDKLWSVRLSVRTPDFRSGKGSSILPRSTRLTIWNIWLYGVWCSGSTPDFGSGCQRFKSSHPIQVGRILMSW